MTVAESGPPPLGRRTLLKGLAAAATGAAVSPGLLVPARAAGAPALVRRGRPTLPFGVQAGEVAASSGLLWARSDRPARMLVEVSRSPDFSSVRTVRGPVLTPDTDLTGKVALAGLPEATQLHYRVVLEDLHDASLRSEPTVGSFRTAPVRSGDVRFLWSGDLAGQGWGIDPAFGGYRIFDSMRALDPDFFLHSGDHVYADGPLTDTVALPDGRIWRNIVTPEKTKVAESLDEFRGQYRYNLLDEPMRRFNAQVPQIHQWDDHEVHNNWYPGEDLSFDPRYRVTDVDVLARRARRAFFDYLPVAPRQGDSLGRIYRKISYGRHLDVFVLDFRTYKDPNTPDVERVPDGGVFGAEQLDWLKRGLTASTATWKVVANDLPLGLVVPDGATPTMEGLANGDPGAPLGRELELADLLSHLHRHHVRDVVWLTADVHYTAAHRYDPARARFTDFTPFWEFVSGPLSAGAFGPNALDATFGPKAVFVAAPPHPNTSPAEGSQFFGEVEIEGANGVMTVRLRDLDGRVLFGHRMAPGD